jgi:diguanylate cyclase (GGDEF)-like protein/PAS domain S-box-containing protein
LYTVILRDITDRRQAEIVLRESEARLRNLLTMLPDAVFVNSGNRISFVNGSAQHLFGANEAALLGRSPLELIHPDSIELVRSRIAALHRGIQVAPLAEVKIVRTDGTTRIVETTSSLIEDHGEVSILVVMRDVTDLQQARADLADSRRTEEQLHALANIDSLTGLHNRRSIDEHLLESVARTKRNAGPMALMFIDVDHFKQINDTYGHAAGDAVLQEIATRIQRCARVTDTVGRYGGDEFVILIEGLHSAEDAELFARKIRTEVAEPFVLDEVTLPVTASIGVAFYTGEDLAPDEVVARADEALYQAKHAGRDAFVVSRWHTEDGDETPL